VNEATNTIYVAIQRTNAVTVIDGAKNTVSALTRTNAQRHCVNPLTNNVYVANKGSNDVTVIAPTFAETAS